MMVINVMLLLSMFTKPLPGFDHEFLIGIVKMCTMASGFAVVFSVNVLVAVCKCFLVRSLNRPFHFSAFSVPYAAFVDCSIFFSKSC